jgi:hypothetical protein
VPSWCEVNLTPGGSFPALVIRGSGEPLAVTVKLNAAPNAAVTVAVLVMATWLCGVTLAGVLAAESPAVECATTVML